MGVSKKQILGGMGLAGAGLGLASWLGSVHWNHKSSRPLTRLIDAHPGGRHKEVSLEEVEQLPTPVARYFRHVLKDGQPFIRFARVTWAGEFRTRRADDGWSPFKATQYFSAQPPGFVWDASVHTAPLMNVRVRDAYVAGEGSMQAKILSLVPVVDEQRKTELNAAPCNDIWPRRFGFRRRFFRARACNGAYYSSLRTSATVSRSFSAV